MTDDQIISVAKVVRNGGHWDQLDIINFGRLIAAAEREACAKVCEERAAYYDQGDDDGPEKSRRGLSARACAAAIRARGQA